MKRKRPSKGKDRSQPSDRPLTPMQELFVEEYLKDLNATQAAIRAGYSKRRASEIGYQLLQKTTVQTAIRAAMDARIKRTRIDSDWTLRRLRWLADSNLARVAKWGSRTRKRTPEGGEPYEEEIPFLDITDSSSLSRAAAFGIDSIKAKSTEFGPELSIKMRNPDRALDLLAKHQGLLEPKLADKSDALEDALKALDAEEKKP